MKKKKTTAKTKSKKSWSAAKAAGGKGAGSDASLRQHLVDLLKGGSAHVQFMDALEEFPPN